jgi:hypothetical protein
MINFEVLYRQTVDHNQQLTLTIVIRFEEANYYGIFKESCEIIRNDYGREVAERCFRKPVSCYKVRKDG